MTDEEKIQNVTSPPFGTYETDCAECHQTFEFVVGFGEDPVKDGWWTLCRGCLVKALALWDRHANARAK